MNLDAGGSDSGRGLGEEQKEPDETEECSTPVEAQVDEEEHV